MYDLVIRGGTVVDGTGASKTNADIAVKDGIIVEIGKSSGRTQSSIDATDLIVAPGFVDPHTHYDAQICWDDLTSPSSWHGAICSYAQKKTKLQCSYDIQRTPRHPIAHACIVASVEEISKLDELHHHVDPDTHENGVLTLNRRKMEIRP